MSTDSHELIGQALGTCTLQRLIGRGGMGAVYLARQSRPRRTVAVKVLKPGAFLESQTRGEFLARFRREADAVAALDHVNIMPIYEYGEQEDLAYLVMPYVTGGTLRQLLEKRGILPLNEVINIISQAAAALDSAHAHGIIHRDLKPANMLFHADGRLLLADFGLAKTINETREFESSGNGHTALTSAGTIVGTPEYLAPEQGTGKHVDARTDVYSLGIVLFQMLGGRVPFSGVSPVAVAIKHALEEPPSLMQLNPAVTPDVEAVVRKAIAKDPADRYASAGDLARALRQAAMKIHPTPRTVEADEAEASPLHLASEQKEEQKGDTDKMALHNAPTEANPRLPSSGEGEDGPAQPARPAPPPLQSGQQSQNEEGADEDEDEETIITASSKAIRTPRIPSSQPGPQPEQKPVPPMPVPQQHKETRHPPAPPLQVQTLQQRQSLSTDQQASPREEQPHARARSPRTGRSFGMLLLGGLITLLLVAGVLGATYFSLSGTKQPASRPSAH
ncbi:MAG: serine/threonine protein kinase, partial [Ktedonobacteraceae bacterium]|nr:serine/threonine protein kinase [Ktedonobacteraceae bacterium]